MRVNLSLAIISMVNHTAIPHVDQTNSVDVCPLRSEDNHSTATASKVRQRENTGETITTIYWLIADLTGRRIPLGWISTRNHSWLILLGLYYYTNTWWTPCGNIQCKEVAELRDLQFISAHTVDSLFNSDKRQVAHLFSLCYGLGRGKLVDLLKKKYFIENKYFKCRELLFPPHIQYWPRLRLQKGVEWLPIFLPVQIPFERNNKFVVKIIELIQELSLDQWLRSH